MNVKEESEKVGLKLNIQKTKIMASVPIASWQIDGETMETVADFILGGSKVTADGDCSHEIKRHLLFGRKVMANLDSILKSKDITLPTKLCLVNAMVFPVVRYGCESWIVKKAECRRINDFELWCWTRLESPLDCKEIKPKRDQSWVSTGRTDAEAETSVLWQPDAKSWLIWKDPDAGKDCKREEKGMAEDEMVGCKLWELVMDREAWRPWGCEESDTTEKLKWTFFQSHWIVTIDLDIIFITLPPRKWRVISPWNSLHYKEKKVFRFPNAIFLFVF